MRHIVAATDGSPASDAALDEACVLAQAFGVPLTVVHVLHAPRRLEEHPGRAVAKLVLHAMRGQADELIARALHRCAMAGVSASGVVAEGAPAEVILRIAKERDADLVVCGSHGRGTIGRALLGSTSTALLHASPGAVLVVPPTVPAVEVSDDRL